MRTLTPSVSLVALSPRLLPRLNVACDLAETKRVRENREMSDVQTEYYWCLRHGQVETDENLCPARLRIGPYESKSAAEQGLRDIDARNKKWEAEDLEWENR